MANAALLATLGDQTSSQAAGSISSLMPSGVILPFGGNTPPTGWLLCDGSTISRTVYADLFQAIGTAHGHGDGSTTFNLPDFRGRFMRGVDGSANRDPDKITRTAANPGGNVGNSVGSVQSNATAKNGLSASAQSSSISLSLNNQSTSHTHSANHNHGSVNTSWIGNHSHQQYVTANPGSGPYNTRHDYNYDANALQIYAQVQTGGAGSHSHSVDLPDIGVTTGGISANHTHTLSSGSASAQTITVADGDNETRPLNINVQYIIKV